MLLLWTHGATGLPFEMFIKAVSETSGRNSPYSLMASRKSSSLPPHSSWALMIFLASVLFVAMLSSRASSVAIVLTSSSCRAAKRGVSRFDSSTDGLVCSMLTLVRFQCSRWLL